MRVRLTKINEALRALPPSSILPRKREMKQRVNHDRCVASQHGERETGMPSWESCQGWLEDMLLSVSMYLVPKAGLEPARLASPPPQDGVSTNSTTSALIRERGLRNYINLIVATRVLVVLLQESNFLWVLFHRLAWRSSLMLKTLQKTVPQTMLLI